MQTRPAAVVAARRTAGLSQEQLAELVGISRTSVQNIETGHVRRPHPRTLKALADAMNVEVTDIAIPDEEAAEVAS